MPGRLMVVDDDPNFAETVRDVATELGYAVALVDTAKDLPATYDDFQPDTIMLDIIMPEVDGIETLQWLADRRSRSNIIIVTGHSPHYAENAQRLGQARGLPPIRTLFKPVRLTDLQAELSEAGPAA